MYHETQKTFGYGAGISEQEIKDRDFGTSGGRPSLHRDPRCTRNGILTDTPNRRMRMCLSSLPQRPTHFQQSLFLRWFRCWVLVLAGLGSTLGFAVGRAKSSQVQQIPGKTEEKAQESKAPEASQASGENRVVQEE